MHVRARPPAPLVLYSLSLSPKDKAVIYVTSKPFHIVYVVPRRGTAKQTRLIFI